MHVLEVVANGRAVIRNSCATCCARRSTPAASAGLPDSAEAAAMARIDALAPEDRAWSAVRPSSG